MSIHATPSRDECLCLARVAEQAEDYKEMVHHIRLLITAASSPKKPTTTLTLEQRNLFSVAYKNLVTPQRTAYRTISWILEREQRKKHERAVRLCEVERERVGREVVTSCEEVIELISTHLLTDEIDPESRIFYLKMQADYHRYLTETLPPISSSPHPSAQAAFAAYTSAWTLALIHLPSTHPTRLGLALNFAVFYYDVYTSPTRASHLAKHAFDAAIDDLDLLDEGSYRDSTMILQLLRDNIMLWAADVDEAATAVDVEVGKLKLGEE